jgi:hypothetical protein
MSLQEIVVEGTLKPNGAVALTNDARLPAFTGIAVAVLP